MVRRFLTTDPALSIETWLALSPSLDPLTPRVTGKVRRRAVNKVSPNWRFATVSAIGIASEQGFYVTGGTLRRGAPSYIERHADRTLYEDLLQGKFCYALTSRNVSITLRHLGEKFRLQEEAQRPLPAAAAGG